MGTPLRFRSGLTSNAVGRPTKLTILRTKPKKGTLRNKAGPAGGRVIVVILKQVPEGCEDLFVAVTVSMPDDFHTRAIGIDPPGKPGYPYMAIIALLPCKCGGIKIPAHLGATFIVIKTTHIKCFAIPIGNFGPAISLIEVELTIGPTNDRVGGVVMITTNKTGKENFPGIPFIKDQIPVYIGVSNDVRSLRNIDLIIDHSNAHWCNQIRILHKNSGFIRDSI